MAHIAIDARVINSGTGTYVVKLLKYLQEIDKTNDYSVLVRKKDENYWKPTGKNFRVSIADFDNYSLAEQLGFKKFLDELNPDLVHFCMPQQPLGYKGKRVTTMHDMILLNTYNSDKNWLVFHAKQLIGRYVWRKIGDISEYLIMISENTKREYLQFHKIPDSKVPVIYEACDMPANKLTPYKDLPFDKFIIYVGQQPDYKNIRKLAEAHQKLLKNNPKLGLVLVGRMNPDTKANQALFKKLDYKNIHFTGFIEDDQRDWLYTRAEAYVFPSLMEGFGLPPLEAMSYGTPVVSSNTSCMPEILGDAALYFNPKDSDDIADKVQRVLDSETLKKDLIKKGFSRIKKYSWRKMAEETHSIYLKALNNK